MHLLTYLNVYLVLCMCVCQWVCAHWSQHTDDTQQVPKAGGDSAGPGLALDLDLNSFKVRRCWDLRFCSRQSPANLGFTCSLLLPPTMEQRRKAEKADFANWAQPCATGKILPGPYRGVCVYTGARGLLTSIFAHPAPSVINWHRIIQPFFKSWPIVWIGDLL